jgi:hypothetical protein
MIRTWKPEYNKTRKRKILRITLSDDARAALKRDCEALGITMSERIERLILAL